MHLNIEHKTRYAFDTPVGYTIQQLHLTPQDGFGQRVKHWEIRVNGRMQSHADAFGNTAHTLVLDTPHSEISITAHGEVETGLNTPPQADVLPLEVYLRDTPLTTTEKRIRSFARLFEPVDGKVDEGVIKALMDGIQDCVTYRKGKTSMHNSAAEALAAGEGGCQDYAHIFIACCRSLGVPARYVSGYLFNAESNSMESHAWADTWLEEEGWRSFDVTTRQPSNGIHVRLATGLDDRDVCPFKGISRQAEQFMSSSLIAHSMEKTQAQAQQ